MSKKTIKFIFTSSLIVIGSLTMQASACVSECVSTSVEHTPIEIQKRKRLLTTVMNNTYQRPLPLTIDDAVLNTSQFSDVLKPMLSKEDFQHITNNKPATTTISETESHFIIEQKFESNPELSSDDYFMMYDQIYKIVVNKKTAEIQFFKHGDFDGDMSMLVYSSDSNTDKNSPLFAKMTLGNRPICTKDDLVPKKTTLKTRVAKLLGMYKRPKGCS